MERLVPFPWAYARRKWQSPNECDRFDNRTQWFQRYSYIICTVSHNNLTVSPIDREIRLQWSTLPVASSNRASWKAALPARISRRKDDTFQYHSLVLPSWDISRDRRLALIQDVKVERRRTSCAWGNVWEVEIGNEISKLKVRSLCTKILTLLSTYLSSFPDNSKYNS